MAAITKAQQVDQAIREGITSGRWPIGSKLPGESELMTEFGVGRGAFREAMSALAKAGILSSTRGKGSFVTGAPPMRSIAICTNLVLFSGYKAHWGVGLLEKMRQVVEENGYRALTVVSHGDTVEELQASTNITDSNVVKDIDGAIALNGSRFIYDLFAAAGIRQVGICRPVPERGFSVVLDYAAMTRMAAELLTNRGHHDFSVMYYGKPEHMRPVEVDYYEEFENLILRAVNGDRQRMLPVGDVNYPAVSAMFRTWWQRPDRGTALFVYDDALCEILSSVLLGHGIRVPEELSILTLANKGRTFPYPLHFSSIGFDMEETARAAWHLLEMQLHAAGPIPDTYVRIIPHFAAGETVR